ncbi:L-histidine N(alpha)-methyltransferase, partial [Georgenia daeguensis]|uniref:L-histidine N(alpha)-methyltransferase n=1 Tax=Georgenia daeguensis TaxID=908355 RepID=UPI0031EC1FBC
MILDDGGDATLLVHKGAVYEKAGAGPAASAEDPEEWHVIIDLLTRTVGDDKKWTRIAEQIKGVTEEFIRNSLVVVNRELGADFDPAAFSYVPFWDPHMERMDLRLRAEVPQQVTIPGADLVLDLAMGEEIRIEISNPRKGQEKYVYTYSDDELQRKLAELKKKNVRWKDPVQRYKGLGEMDA